MQQYVLPPNMTYSTIIDYLVNKYELFLYVYNICIILRTCNEIPVSYNLCMYTHVHMCMYTSYNLLGSHYVYVM